MADPQVTIVVVPRERFSFTERSLASIYRNTSFPFHLIYVSGGAPTPVTRHLADEARLKGFQLLAHPGFLSPNQARNLALPHVRTKYVVFVDNDVLVAPRWLDALVQCAEDTDAWIVGPLYLVGEFDRGMIHMAGGTLRFGDHEGKPVLWDDQFLFDTSLHEAPLPLPRRSCDYVEFHCMLLRTEVFAHTGPLDESLLSLHEERDCCLVARRAGGLVYVEPKAVVTYVPPPPCQWWDLSFFMLRWSEAWNVTSVRHFNDKWGITAVRHVSDRAGSPDHEGSILGFARTWRRRVAGLSVRADSLTESPRRPLEEAELMVALFQSVDRDSFDLALSTSDGAVVVSASSLTPHETLHKLPEVMRTGEDSALNVTIRARDQGRAHEPCLLRFDDVGPADLPTVQPYAFMTLETEPDRYQCWLAVDRRSAATTLASRPPGGAADGRPGQSVHVAGSTPVGPRSSDGTHRARRVHLVEGVVGRLVTAKQIQSPDLRPFLPSGHLC